jgi:uncharacterized membrane protein
MSQEKFRWPLIDQLRGFAIVLMLIFHTGYNLTVYQWIVPTAQGAWFWWWLPRLIVTLFLFTTGVSLAFAHGSKIRWNPFFRRWFKLVGAALLVSATTYWLFPQNWVYFGTLHAIAACSLLGLPLLKYPRMAMLIALLIFSLHVSEMFTIPFFRMSHSSMDYIPPFPWVSATWAGIACAHWRGWQQLSLPVVPGRILQRLGRHSLIIYLVHQPLIFGALGLVS